MNKPTKREMEIALSKITKHTPMWSEEDVAQVLADYRMELVEVVKDFDITNKGCGEYSDCTNGIAKSIEEYGGEDDTKETK